MAVQEGYQMIEIAGNLVVHYTTMSRRLRGEKKGGN